MLATMCPDIVFARLPVILTCGIVTALLGFILIKIEFHSHPLSVGSHAKKGIGYPMRVLISIVPSYTTGNCCTAQSSPERERVHGELRHSKSYEMGRQVSRTRFSSFFQVDRAGMLHMFS